MRKNVLDLEAQSTRSGQPKEGRGRAPQGVVALRRWWRWQCRRQRGWRRPPPLRPQPASLPARCRSPQSPPRCAACPCARQSTLASAVSSLGGKGKAVGVRRETSTNTRLCTYGVPCASGVTRSTAPLEIIPRLGAPQPALGSHSLTQECPRHQEKIRQRSTERKLGRHTLHNGPTARTHTTARPPAPWFQPC